MLGLQAGNLLGQYLFDLLARVSFFRSRARVGEVLAPDRKQNLDGIAETNQFAMTRAKVHERAVQRDARQPGGESRLASEGVNVREGVLEAFLNNIFGILAIPRYAERHLPKTPGVRGDKMTESGWMSHASCRQKHCLLRVRANVCGRGIPCPHPLLG